MRIDFSTPESYNQIMFENESARQLLKMISEEYRICSIWVPEYNEDEEYPDLVTVEFLLELSENLENFKRGAVGHVS